MVDGIVAAHECVQAQSVARHVGGAMPHMAANVATGTAAVWCNEEPRRSPLPCLRWVETAIPKSSEHAGNVHPIRGLGASLSGARDTVGAGKKTYLVVVSARVLMCASMAPATSSAMGSVCFAAVHSSLNLVTVSVAISTTSFSGRRAFAAR
jgi:hypothetical protein